MLIDADVHISPTPQGGTSIGIDELLRRMDRAGVMPSQGWQSPRPSAAPVSRRTAAGIRTGAPLFLLCLWFCLLAVAAAAAGAPLAAQGPVVEDLVAVGAAGLAPPLFLAIARVIVPAGAAIDGVDTAGPRLLVVESGMLTVAAAGNAAGLGRASVIQPRAEDRVLAPDDRLGLAAGGIGGLRNDGARPTVYLDAALFPAADRPDDGAFTTDDGVSFQLLAGAVVEAAPTGRVEFRLRRLHLPSGAGLPDGRRPGLALAYVESGALRLAPASDGVLFSRAAAAAPYSVAGPMRPVAAGSAVALAAGASLLLPMGSAVESRNERASVTTVLVVEVLPVADVGERPAASPVR